MLLLLLLLVVVVDLIGVVRHALAEVETLGHGFGGVFVSPRGPPAAAARFFSFVVSLWLLLLLGTLSLRALPGSGKGTAGLLPPTLLLLLLLGWWL